MSLNVEVNKLNNMITKLLYYEGEKNTEALKTNL